MRFDGVTKFDTQTQQSETHWYGDGVFGSESPFIPSGKSDEEADGYVITFVTNENNGQSEALLLDAQNISDEPLARIKLPQRVPLGFHSCWIKGDKLGEDSTK